MPRVPALQQGFFAWSRKAVVLLLFLSAFSWPLREVQSQRPPILPQDRAMCAEKVKIYLTFVKMYRGWAPSSDGRLQILTRFLSEGPAWMQLVLKSRGLAPEEARIASELERAMGRYNQTAPTRTAEMDRSSTDLDAVVAGLEQLSRSIGKEHE